MKKLKLITAAIVFLYLSGCVVFSYYPLYTEEDLFPNDILTGEWADEEDQQWVFEHAYFGKKAPENIDSTSYILTLKSEKENEQRESKFRVHIVKLGGHYFLDFYLEDYLSGDDFSLADFHIVPVHTFAKLEFTENSLQINWFDQDWLADLIEENKIRIHHENNGEYILLTAKPRELQKFVTKYVNSQKAFQDGIEAILTRK